MLTRLLSRRFFRTAGIAWGLTAIILGGLIVAPLAAYPGHGQSETHISEAYHYHVSAVLVTGLTMFLYLAGGRLFLPGIRQASLNHFFKSLLLIDILSMTGGILLTFALGWLKEIADAMHGSFADPADLHADLYGIAMLALTVGALLLPAHGLGVLVADSLRRRFLRSAASPATRAHLDTAFALEDDINRRQTDIRETTDTLSILEREIERLVAQLDTLPPSEHEGASGQALRQEIDAKEEQIKLLNRRLTDLEADNRALRKALHRLGEEAAHLPGGVVIRKEVELLGKRCALQAESTIRQQSRIANMRTHIRQPDPAAVPVANATASPQPEPASASRAGNADSEKEIRLRLQNAEARIREVEAARAEAESRCRKMADENHALRASLESERRNAEDNNRNEEDNERSRKMAQSLRRRVLIVDDDKALSRIFANTLRQTGVLDIQVAHSALEAIDRMKEEKSLPDLILMDIMMPGLSGTEFCAALERKRRTKFIKIVFCSAKPANMIPELETLSHVDFIQKPIGVKDLQRRILSALDLPGQLDEE